jgi:hypothetical protein
MFIQDISEANSGNILEELLLSQLIGLCWLINNQGSDEELAILTELKLTICDKSSPVAIKTLQPFLTLF